MPLHRLGWPLTFVEGARGNIKVVRREDLAVFASLVGRLHVGDIYSAHRGLP